MEEYLTDKKCRSYRNTLIKLGYLKRGTVRSKRQQLIDRGLLTDNREYPKSNKQYKSKNEGKYKVKRINSDEEYNRRKELYLWALTDIIRTRKELRLELGSVSSKDPKWFF